LATIAADLAKHVVHRRSTPLPPEAADEAKALIQDYFGVALRGSMTKPATIVADYQLRYSLSPAEATIIGRAQMATAPGAAFANAVAAHSLELDDVDERSLLHFSAPVVSAALAAAECEGATGKQFLAAVVAGCEVMQAVSDGVNPGMRDRGFHSTAVCGVFGATAAAGALFMLDPPVLTSAFGIAGAQAAGLFDVYGPSMQKRIQPGPAAHNGIVSARLANAGFEGAGTVFDGRFGLFKAFTPNADPDATYRRIRTGAPLGIEFKPYACFRPIHTAIDCALAIRPLVIQELGAIRSILLYRNPEWANYHLNPSPATTEEAKGSINHAVAVALLEGSALLEQFSPDRIQDPVVRRLSRMLTVEINESLPRGDSCHLRVTMLDGRVVEHRVDYPKGSVQRPMSPEAHIAKFRYLTDSLLSDGRRSSLIDLIQSIERLESLRGLFKAARLDRDTTRLGSS
jgi:2-methylcitrate dehydratase PrpD